MWPDRISNPGTFALEFALATALRSPAKLLTWTFSMTLRKRSKVFLRVWSYDFYDMTLSTE